MGKKKFKDTKGGKVLLGALELALHKATGVDLGTKAEEMGEVFKKEKLRITKKLPPWAEALPFGELIDILQDGKVTKDEVPRLIALTVKYGLAVLAVYAGIQVVL